MLLLIAIAACQADRRGADETGLCDTGAVRSVVPDFGGRLQRVSTTASDSLVGRAVQDVYAPVVTTALLDEWTTHPHMAPGRAVSSPWPDRIEVRGAEAVDGAGIVRGDVVYRASADSDRVSAASREGIVLRFVQDGRRWRIASVDVGNDRSAPRR